MALRRSFRNIIRSSSQYLQSIDLPLFGAVILIALVGILNLYGIGGSQGPFLMRQIVLVIFGVMVMVALSFFNYRYLKNYSFPVLLLYGISLVLLVLTLTSGSIRGVRAWIIFGGVTFEASELAKLAVIVLMAKYFSQRHVHIKQFRHIISSGFYVAIPTVVILAQPDLGSAVIVLILWGAMLLAAGMSKRHLFLLVAVALVTAYLAWVFVLRPYQKERILSFINPYRDPTGIGYNIIQSKIAIGSGGLWGVGLGNGSQTTLGFLPEPYNDFAFAALAEQFGLFGAVAVMGLVLFIVFRIVTIGERTGNNFAKLFAIGLAVFIFAHVFINAAVNVGILPITGIPFSFLSYGGSHLISLMAGIGTLQSMKRYG